MTQDQKPDFYKMFDALTTNEQQHSVYSKMVSDLESPCQENMQKFVANETLCRILHAVEGVASEAGEQVDQIKKAMAYGKPIDLVNMDEEMGDVLWYIQLYCNARGFNLTHLMAMNYAKLRIRYGDKFSTEACLNRNLEVERQNLEASASTATLRVQHDN